MNFEGLSGVQELDPSAAVLGERVPGAGRGRGRRD